MRKLPYASRITYYVLLLAADLAGLAGLAADALALVGDAFALVGLRLSELAYAGRLLADDLLVDPCHAEAGGRLDVEGDAGGGLMRTGCEKPSANTSAWPSFATR